MARSGNAIVGGRADCRPPRSEAGFRRLVVRPDRRSPPSRAKPLRFAETLRKAIEWRRQLDAGEIPNQAAIARREGITRDRCVVWRVRTGLARYLLYTQRVNRMVALRADATLIHRSPSDSNCDQGDRLPEWC